MTKQRGEERSVQSSTCKGPTVGGGTRTGEGRMGVSWGRASEVIS